MEMSQEQNESWDTILIPINFERTFHVYRTQFELGNNAAEDTSPIPGNPRILAFPGALPEERRRIKGATAVHLTNEISTDKNVFAATAKVA